jgi:hypothetical protein
MTEKLNLCKSAIVGVGNAFDFFLETCMGWARNYPCLLIVIVKEHITNCPRGV